MRQWLTRARVPGLLVLGALIGGCAVLTIDVDVYKGPLVNDEAVQVEQVAVMAIGAKPLLIQLRDRLEVKYRSSAVTEDDLRRELANLRKEKWHRFDFVAHGQKRFADDRAIQVNAVLSLYEDVGDARLASMLAAARQAAQEYEVAWDKFSPSEIDRHVLGQLRPAFAHESYTASIPREPLIECKPGTPELLQMLRRSYEDFLLIPPDISRLTSGVRILVMHRCFLQREKEILSEAPRMWPGTSIQTIPHPRLDGTRLGEFAKDKLIPREVLSQNAVYKALADVQLIDFHSRLLFRPSADDERKRFVRRVTDVAEAWAEGYEALARLWRVSLHLISAVNKPEFLDPVRQKQFTEGIARLTSLLIHPTLLVLVLEGPDAPPSLQKLKPELGKRGVTRVKGKVLDRTQTENVSEAVRQLLIQAPEETVHGLIEANRLATADDFRRENMGGLQSPVARSFGIIRGPDLRLEEITEQTFARLSAGDVSQGLVEVVGAAGFEGGRLPLGLETLIKDYRLAAHSGGELRKENTKRQLLDELVGFAQKVLFVGNLSSLIDDATVREYVFLLQAIGNSILTQVDELKRLVRREKEQKGRAMVERAIRQDIWDWLKEQRVKAGGVTKGGAPKADRQIELKEEKLELDPAIAELRYLYLNALTGGPGDAAKLLDAIREAYEQRSRMIYLRPAAAFLRNSYPVTSLQRDSKAIWANLLTEHAYRQLFGVREDRRDVKAIQEFDKQFWQNVNTVRVAGADRTNYVVVKDDVGNWYVKNFAADPEPIIKAAKSMALFAAGGSIGAEEIIRASDKIAGKPTSPGQAGDGAARLLASQRIAAQKKDDADTQALLADLSSMQDPKALRTRVETEWKRKGIQDPELKLLSVALELSEEKCRVPAKEESPAATLSKQLAGLKSCQHGILFNLDKNLIESKIRDRATAPGAQPTTSQVQLTDDTIAKAKDVVKVVFRDLGVSFIQLREQIVKDHTTRLKAILEEASH